MNTLKKYVELFGESSSSIFTGKLLFINMFGWSVRCLLTFGSKNRCWRCWPPLSENLRPVSREKLISFTNLQGRQLSMLQQDSNFICHMFEDFNWGWCEYLKLPSLFSIFQPWSCALVSSLKDSVPCSK